MNIIEKIKSLVMSAESFNFAVYDLAEGGKIECDTETLEVGSIVSLVKEDGSKELAPAGPHTLADGRTIVLDDAAKVNEIKEADAPTATEEQATEQKMAMEVDPELMKAVAEMIKGGVSSIGEEDANNLANQIIYAITAYSEISESEAEAEDSVPMIEDMKMQLETLSNLVLEMAKKQNSFSSEVDNKLSKIPTGKAISEMEFASEPEKTDMVAARIAAIKNLNK
jgi:O6-methylguanine-DNA--protein-cysteine methyltransferase